MAYSEQYRGKFASYRGAEYDVVLYRDTAISQDKTIKIQNVTFRRTVKDRFLTSSVDIDFVNIYGINEFNDLCSNTEREWMIQITQYGNRSNIFFKGWLVVGVAEQDISSNKTSISITATDELLKLKEIDIENVDFGTKYSFKKIITDGLWKINSVNVYINSQLFYNGEVRTAENTLFEQSFLDADFFYKNNIETISYWDAINEILKTTNCYLYQHKNKYYIERYNDIGNTNWAYISASNGNNYAVTSTVDSSYNKQDDFNYTQSSQRVMYESGISNFTIDLDPKEYISIIPNSWNTPLTELDDSFLPLADSLNYGEWYLNTSASQGDTFTSTTGTNDYGMNKYVKYENLTDGATYDIICAKAKVTFNAGNSTNLQIKYKTWVQTGMAFNEDTEWRCFFAIRKGAGGSKANNMIVLGEDGKTTITPYSPSNFSFVVTGNRQEGGALIEVTQNIELNDIKQYCDTNETLVFYFRPAAQYNSDQPDTPIWSEQAILGDFEIKISADNEDNQYMYDVNQGFVNTKEDDLKIFDISNYNYVNGIFLDDNTKTSPTVGWTDDNGITYNSLVDHYVKSEVGYSYVTRKALNTSLIFNTETIIKPLVKLSDNNISSTEFLVTEYTYDFVKSRYGINNAKEYSTDKGEINIIE